MAETVMGPLLGALQELVMKEAQAMVAVDDDVHNLRDKHMWLQAFLRDAEPRRRARNDGLIRVCLHQIRGAVFDAEDAVDCYLLEIDLSKYPWRQAIPKFFAGFTTQLCVRSDLSRRVRSINSRLERIIENKDNYKIDDQDSSPVTTWRQSTDINAAIENLGRFTLPLVGRDDTQEKIKKALKEESKDPMVITVVGESGVGKTKLMTAIYEDPLNTEHFRERVWVSFAPGLSASQILKLVLLRLGLKLPAKSSYDDGDDPDVSLKAALLAALRAKIYLVVLDGEVSNAEWNKILSSLPKGGAKSRVVRIMRRNPAEEGEAQSPTFKNETIILLHLDEYKSMVMFRKALCKGRDGEKHKGILDNLEKDEKMKNHLESIHRITDGLPLSVVLLAGLLQTKEFPGEWCRVFEYLNAKLDKSKRDNIILSMCFDDLPHNLKSCFLYLACFPVNMLVKARTMVCMWMAEGFLSPKEGMTMEQVGSHFLNELAQRRLINIPPVEYADPGFESVTVQSRVHDFLLQEAQEAGFVEVNRGHDVPILTTTRRLALQNHSNKFDALATPLPRLRSIISSFEKEDKATTTPAGDQNIKGTKTKTDRVFCHLLWRPKIGCDEPNEIIQRLLRYSKFLSVISLDGLHIGIELPDEIGSVVHLQHLAVTSCSLKVIPSSIGKLTRLQTLDVRGTEVNTLPMGFWKIRTLRHVFGSIVLPKRVGHLEHLRNLTTVNHGNNGVWNQKTFHKMINLDTLFVEGISACSLQAIYVLTHLVILRLTSGEQAMIPSDLFTRSVLPRLQMMWLDGKMEKLPALPDRKFTFPTLTQLILKNTMVPQSFIDQLGTDLPLLSVFVLLEGSYEMESIIFKPGFNNINYVMLDVELLLVEIQSLAFGDRLEKVEIVTYSPHIRVNISDKPDIKDKIKIDDKYFRGEPEVPKGGIQAVLKRLMAATAGARTIASRIQTKP